MWLFRKKHKPRMVDPGLGICMHCGKGSMILVERKKHPNLNKAVCPHCHRKGGLVY